MSWASARAFCVNGNKVQHNPNRFPQFFQKIRKAKGLEERQSGTRYIKIPNNVDI